MRLAQAYNSVVGSNITHFDVDEWGFIDHLLVVNALDYRGQVMKIERGAKSEAPGYTSKARRTGAKRSKRSLRR